MNEGIQSSKGEPVSKLDGPAYFVLMWVRDTIRALRNCT